MSTRSTPCRTHARQAISTTTALQAPTTAAGPTLLTNALNTAGILDYAPIPGAYKELTSFQIANESALTRGAATPIFYNLKITQNGLLSFSYSVSGGAYSYVIKNQSITASNGPLPASFRVGFAGSDGGASNVHEIMCFKAASRFNRAAPRPSTRRNPQKSRQALRPISPTTIRTIGPAR